MATVLVDPTVLDDLELDLMSADFRVWNVHTTTVFPDPQQAAMQIRRALIDWSAGRWELASAWTVVCGPRNRVLAGHVRYNRGLGGVPRLGVPRESTG